jgi:hypothetical protein
VGYDLARGPLLGVIVMPNGKVVITGVISGNFVSPLITEDDKVQWDRFYGQGYSLCNAGTDELTPPVGAPNE